MIQTFTYFCLLLSVLSFNDEKTPKKWQFLLANKSSFIIYDNWSLAMLHFSSTDSFIFKTWRSLDYPDIIEFLLLKWFIPMLRCSLLHFLTNQNMSSCVLVGSFLIFLNKFIELRNRENSKIKLGIRCRIRWQEIKNQVEMDHK